MHAASGSGRLAGFGLVLALHGGVLALLLQFDATRAALKAAAPIVVRLITPEPERRVEQLPKPLPIAPRVHRPKPVTPPPIITAATEAPSPRIAPPPPPTPAPEPVAEVPAPTPAVQSAPTPSAPPSPAPAIAPPVTPASFSADYLNNPAPSYPMMSRRLGEEGKVILRVLVNEQGLPAEVQLKTSSGFNRLDSVALDTVKHWRFVPARRGKDPVAAWVLVPLSFSLRS